MLRKRIGDLEGALEDFAKTAELDPKHIDFCWNKAYGHVREGRVETALSYVDRNRSLRSELEPRDLYNSA